MSTATDSAPSPTNTASAWLQWAIATGAGSGCLRPGPGTWGSLFAALLLLPLPLLAPPAWWLTCLIVATVLATIAGLAVCPWAIAHYRRGDPSQVVIDEIAGLWLTCTLVALVSPSLMQAAPYATIAAAFIAFRVFDVAKPWPLCRLERLPGGLGIMLDDLGAAVPACGCSIAALIWLL